MALKPVSVETVEQGQKELREKFSSGQVVPPVNLSAAKALAGVRQFEFPSNSGIVYEVKTIPYIDGIQINDLYLRIRELSEQKEAAPTLGAAVYQRWLQELLDLAWKLSVPKSRWNRIRKWLGLIKNPFYKMSEGDAGELIGFFLMRRMISTVQFHHSASKKGPLLPTS